MSEFPPEAVAEIREFITNNPHAYRPPYMTNVERIPFSAQNQSRSCPAIIRAKIAITEEVKGVRKDRYNKHHKYEFIGHDDVTDALQPAFIKHGVDQMVSVEEFRRDGAILFVKVKITWTASEDGTQQEVFSYGEATSKASTGRPDSVEVGAAVSYAVKTAQLKNFMLIGGYIPDPEETDGDPEREAIASEPRNDHPDTERPPPSEPRENKKSAPEQVDNEVVARLAARYDEVQSDGAFRELNKEASAVIKRLNKSQRAMLEAAYVRAQERTAAT